MVPRGCDHIGAEKNKPSLLMRKMRKVMAKRKKIKHLKVDYFPVAACNEYTNLI